MLFPTNLLLEFFGIWRSKKKLQFFVPWDILPASSATRMFSIICRLLVMNVAAFLKYLYYILSNYPFFESTHLVRVLPFFSFWTVYVSKVWKLCRLFERKGAQWSFNIILGIPLKYVQTNENIFFVSCENLKRNFLGVMPRFSLKYWVSLLENKTPLTLHVHLSKIVPLPENRCAYFRFEVQENNSEQKWSHFDKCFGQGSFNN